MIAIGSKGNDFALLTVSIEYSFYWNVGKINQNKKAFQ